MVESAPLGEDAVRSTDADDKEPSVTCPDCGGGPYKSEQGLKNHMAAMHDQPWQDEDTLRREYHEKERSTYELAGEWGCDKKAILNWMNRFGIERRPATRDIDRGWRDKEKMERLYLACEMSVEDIADYLDSDTSVITRWLHRHDIETRPQKAPSGEDSIWWRGGISERYWPGDDWWGQKHKALRRDQYRCQSCGATHRDIGRNPDVHHIKPIRMTDDGENPNELSNLITLCRSCHKRAEGMAPLLPDGITR